MAFEFKKLSDVNTLAEMKEGLNVLAVDGSEVVKIDVSEIVNDSVDQAVEVILESDVLAEASETTNVLVEENGSLKKAPVNLFNNTNASNTLIIYPENGYSYTGGIFFTGPIEDENSEQVTNDMVIQAMQNGIVYVNCQSDSQNELSQIIYSYKSSSDMHPTYFAYFMNCSPSLVGFEIFDGK